MKTYKNKFYNKHNSYSREFFQSDENKILYKGHEIHKYNSQYHIVFSGVCIGMMGSIRACKDRIDNEFVKVVNATREEPANDIIKRAGIKTKYLKKYPIEANWTYKGITVPRPIVNKWEEKVLNCFGIKIQYTPR